MRLRFYASLLLVTLITTACESTTDEIGSSLISSNMDQLEVSTDTFQVTSRSIVVDSIFSRSPIGILGKVKDPETGAYVAGDFMTQFHSLEGLTLVNSDNVVSKENGHVYADSCEIRLFFDKNNFYGDSLATMKLRAYELSKPYEESEQYYTNFDPIDKGYVRAGGLQVDKAYSLVDMGEAKNVRDTSTYTSIRISLNAPYTDTEGIEYKNFGSYVLRKYYENPSDFKNSYNFTHNVVPGFYFKHTNGLGSIAYISASQFRIFFKYKDTTTHTGVITFGGTEEVIQSTHINNDSKNIELANDLTGTYLKSPAGILTELTLPIDEIYQNHQNDTINSAELTLQRINNTVKSEYSLDTPKTLLLIPKDSVNSFFVHKSVTDSKTSYITSADTKSITSSSTINTGTYTFHNIGGLIKRLSELKKAGNTSEAWNKVVVIPITTTSVTVNNSTVITGVYNDMKLTQTKLVGGNTPIKIKVIYSKFK